MIYGILSLNIYQKDNNWGSILQSWALQQVLRREGVETWIVNYKPKSIRLNTAKYPVLYNWPIKSKHIKYIGDSKSFLQRDKKFRKFIKENYTISKPCDSRNISSLGLDGFIAGSDIIWNEDFWNGIEPAYFCDCVGMNSKINMAYAPSMGSNNFSAQIEEKMPRLLENFQFISIREQSRVGYIQKFTDKHVYHAIDPTLLLPEMEYEKICAERIISGGYVLVYCVGQDMTLIEHAVEYADIKHLKIVLIKCVPGVSLKLPNAIVYDNAGIDEWLSLIKYADFIFTTSFHACIFSMIFKKQFYTVYTDFSKDKICGLLDMVGINNKNYYKEKYQSQVPEIDYKDVYNCLGNKQKESMDFLKLLKKGV